MEDTNINPISGEQVPLQELSVENQTGAALQPQNQSNTSSAIPQPASAKEFIIEKKMNTLKRSVIILGSILVMLMIALVLVLAMLSSKPTVNPAVTVTPVPTAVTPPENENVPKDVVDGVNRIEAKVAGLDIEENELSFPKIDWEIEF
jgi:hypothetical protein